MKSRVIVVFAALLMLAARGSASAHYWKLAGPPEFAPDLNGVPALEAGQSKTINDGREHFVQLMRRSIRRHLQPDPLGRKAA